MKETCLPECTTDECSPECPNYDVSKEGKQSPNDGVCDDGSFSV